MAIKHTKVVTVPDDGTSPVGSDEWNDNHTIDDNTLAVSKLLNNEGTSGQVLTSNGGTAPTYQDIPAAGVSTTLPSTQIYLGNSSNVATATAVTGVVAISNTGVTSVSTLNQDTTGNADTATTATTVTDNAITLDKMAHGTDGNLITYDVNGAPAAVATGTVGQVLTSAGANAVPAFADAAEASPLSAEGDIYYYSGSANARLPRGAANQVLTTNAGATAISWADPSGGGDHTEQDFTVQASHATDPASGTATLYVKTIDSNNEGLFIKMKKNGNITYVQVG
tara:strand:- start:1258 stop:2103 length:846 start_codon:yes stop_codon:yes gene_type:complete